MSLLLYLEFLKISSRRLFTSSDYENDSHLIDSIRLVLGAETNARIVSRFFNETVIVKGKDKSKTEMTVLQLLLEQRTRFYGAGREKVFSFFSSFFNQVTKRCQKNVVIFHA